MLSNAINKEEVAERYKNVLPEVIEDIRNSTPGKEHDIFERLIKAIVEPWGQMRKSLFLV